MDLCLLSMRSDSFEAHFMSGYSVKYINKY